MDSILEQQAMDALNEIQANVAYAEDYDYSFAMLGVCRPTNCQNQW